MQLFHIDQQTIDDLEIFGKESTTKSVFSCFDFTKTIGGKDALVKMFKNPIVEMGELKDRNVIIKDLQDKALDLNFNKEALDYIEFYLRNNDRPQVYSPAKAIENSFKYTFWPDQEHYLKQRGTQEVLNTLIFLKTQFSELDPKKLNTLFKRIEVLLSEVFANPIINSAVHKRPRPLKNLEIEKCDFAIRNTEIRRVKEIIALIYELDAFNAVAKATEKYKLAFPTFNLSDWMGVKLEGVFHLFLDEPVANDITIDIERNVCFITGVNMSGKSTIIKSVAVSVYLAHLGFPVPARKMEMSLLGGLLTTINLSDDLTKGRSHFYNEVLRVKSVVNEISNTKNVLVVFDELFRGTNVKDAFESSLSIVESFSKLKDSLFIISTHIVEVAEQLQKNEKINFCYLKTIIENDKPSFNYKLQEGLTADRIGFWMLKNEGIFEMLQKKIDSQNKIGQG